MVGYQEYINTGFQRRLSQFSVSAGTIRVRGMHVQINDQFLHGFPFLLIPDTLQ
jgi:hypothetical protein